MAANDPLLSETEQRVLDLFDKLQELQLEIALLKAQQSHQHDASAGQGSNVENAQNQLLHARASYVLRKDVILNVMTANPILKAVHNGTSASPIERDLLPHIKDRDDTSMTLARQSSELKQTLEDLTAAQAESLRAARRNVELTSELLRLAAESRARSEVNAEDHPEAAGRLRRLEEQVKTSRQRWRVMKGTASAVVAGSGVDWTRDATLREIVLDLEDEG